MTGYQATDESSGQASTALSKSGWWILAAALLMIPVAFDPRLKDTFRLPKELLFDGFGVIAMAWLVFAATSRHRPRPDGSTIKAAAVASALVLGWTLVSTLLAENRFLAVQTLTTVACSVAIFWMAVMVASTTRSLKLIDVAMAGALLNAVLAALQEFGIWQPFQFPPDFVGQLQTTGLAGNPRDVGMLILAPAVVAVVATVVYRNRRRGFYAAIAFVLLAGLIATRTRTTLIAYAVALIFTLTSIRRKYAVAVVLIIGVAIFAATASSVTLRRGVSDLVESARQRDWRTVFSERLPAYLTAVEMIRDRPLVGAGPGAYKWLYMQYRVRLPARYEPEWLVGAPLNFREAHNDHLQVFAEMGLIGYVILLVALGALIRRPRQIHTTESTSEMARALRIPLVAAIALSMLAQFPLHLAASRFYFIYFAALVIGWDDSE